MEIGQIVCSKAGSEKDSFFAVIAISGNYVYVSNGKRFKLANPKKKNPKHLAKTGASLQMETILTDKSLRNALAAYRNNTK